MAIVWDNLGPHDGSRVTVKEGPAVATPAVSPMTGLECLSLSSLQ